MPFRSESYWFKRIIKHLRDERPIFKRIGISVLSFVLFVLIGAGESAQAALAIVPTRGGSLGSLTPTNQAVSTGFGTSTTAIPSSFPFYYYVGDGNFGGTNSFVNFSIIKVGPRFTAEDEKPSFANRIEVSVTSYTTQQVTGNQQAVIQIFATNSAGNLFAVPIATVNGVECGLKNCVGQTTGPSANITGAAQLASYKYWYAAMYMMNSTVTIGFYPQDVCKAYYYIAGSTNSATGCNTENINEPSANTPTVLPITISLRMAPSGNPDYKTLQSSTEIDKTKINFTFQIDKPDGAISCPGDVASAYSPNDGSIFISTSGFKISTPSNSDAPAGKLYLVAKQVPTFGDATQPDISSNFNSANDLVTSVNLDGTVQIASGFKNSTDDERYPYNVSFLVQDLAGIYTAPSAVTSCWIQGVEAASIQGFLKDSKCFIATASFRSADSPPVMLLRKFRDEILMESAWGEKFVNWYYQWSPEPAEWLIEHPLFRYPILLLLAPLEAVAWLCLHPLIFGLFTGTGILFLLAVGISVRKRSHVES